MQDGPKGYWIKLARPVIETAVVQVTAESHDEAVAKALGVAENLTPRAWEGAFDEAAYGIDVIDVVASDELQAGESAEELMRGYTEENIRYLPLFADTDSGEGKLQMQPWLLECSDLMVADILRDWLEQLEGAYSGEVAKVHAWLSELKNRADAEFPQNVIRFLPYLYRKRDEEH